eukprot:scaffold56807_cov51-Attheya_sp.AAC.4
MDAWLLFSNIEGSMAMLTNPLNSVNVTEALECSSSRETTGKENLLFLSGVNETWIPNTRAPQEENAFLEEFQSNPSLPHQSFQLFSPRLVITDFNQGTPPKELMECYAAAVNNPATVTSRRQDERERRELFTGRLYDAR